MNAPIPEIRMHNDKVHDDVFQVSLMEEPLHSENAGMPVLHLLAALRQYHRLRDFSHQERFGTPDPQSRQALSELSEAQQSLQALTSTVGGREKEFLIEASLNLRMARKPASHSRYD